MQYPERPGWKKNTQVGLSFSTEMGPQDWGLGDSQTFLFTRSLIGISQLLNLCQSYTFCKLPLKLRIHPKSPFGSQNPDGPPLSTSHSLLIHCFHSHPIPHSTSLFYMASIWTLPSQHCPHSLFHFWSVSVLTGPSQQDIPDYPKSITQSLLMGPFSKTKDHNSDQCASDNSNSETWFKPPTCIWVPPNTTKDKQEDQGNPRRVWRFCKCD